MDLGNTSEPRAAATTGSQPLRAGATGAADTVRHLIDRWQSTADEIWLERLLEVVTPAVHEVTRRILVRHGVRDPDAEDDAVSLVFDHLRRLAHPLPHGGGQEPERRVAPFEPNRGRRPVAVDTGLAYVAWLSRERALDVVRRQRRLRRRCQLLDDTIEKHVVASAATTADAGDQTALLHAAIARLPARERLICDLLLAGRSQAEIAGLLGLCGGTVSRIRQRTIAALRDAFAAS